MFHCNILVIVKCYQETKKSDNALFSHLTYLVLQHYLAKEETQDRTLMHCACITLATAAVLLTSFLLNHAPKLNALITRGVIQQREYEL